MLKPFTKLNTPKPLSATGAWFTDKDNQTSDDLTFGTLNIAVSGANTIAIANTISELDGPVMPGSTITATFTVENSGNATAWLRYKLSVIAPKAGTDGSAYVTFDMSNIEGYDEATGYVYVANKLAGEDSTTIDFTASVSKTDVTNIAQGTSFAVKVEVEALQSANTAETNSATIWAGVTPEEVPNVN